MFNSLHDGDVPGVRDAVAPLVAAAEDVGDLQEIQTQIYFIQQIIWENHFVS